MAEDNQAVDALPERVAGLVERLGAAGFNLAAGEDPIALAGAIVDGHAKYQRDGAELHELLNKRDGFSFGEGETCFAAAARVIDNLDVLVALREQELGEVKASLTATRGHATRAKNEAAVLREARSPTPRKVGRPVARFGKPGVAYSPELAAIAIAGEESVEIVFSNGKAEIIDLAPVTARAHAWLQSRGRHMLREAVELEGGDADLEVAGFALLAGGEQVGWCELPEPVRVPKHGRVRLENCIVF